MSKANQQAPAQQAPAQQQSNKPAISDKLLDYSVKFMPFMEREEITLSVRTVLRWIAKPTKKGFDCPVEQVMKFLHLCKARELNPWSGDAYLVGYDSNDGPEFSLITAHQALVKRAEIHPEFDGMSSGVIVIDAEKRIVEREGAMTYPGDTIYGAWATVFFKTRTHPMKKKIKLATYDTGYSRWKKDPAGMVVKVAEAAAYRGAFPTTCGGLYLEEETRNDREAESRGPFKVDELKNRLGPAKPQAIAGETVSQEMPDIQTQQSVFVQPEREPGDDPPENEQFDSDGNLIPTGPLPGQKS